MDNGKLHAAATQLKELVAKMADELDHRVYLAEESYKEVNLPVPVRKTLGEWAHWAIVKLASHLDKEEVTFSKAAFDLKFECKKDEDAEAPVDELELCHWTRDQIEELGNKFAHVTQQSQIKAFKSITAVDDALNGFKKNLFKQYGGGKNKKLPDTPGVQLYLDQRNALHKHLRAVKQLINAQSQLRQNIIDSHSALKNITFPGFDKPAEVKSNYSFEFRYSSTPPCKPNEFPINW